MAERTVSIAQDILGRMTIETWPQILACAREVVRVTGDLPVSIFYQLARNAPAEVELAVVLAALEATRPADARPYPPKSSTPM